MSNIDPLEAAWNESEAELSGEEVTTEEATPEGTSEVVETEEAPATSEVPPASEATPAWYEGKDNELVKIGDQEVPFDELRKGYMRQSDYTRKTQEAAALRKQAEWAQGLQENLRRDPLGTLQAMAEELKLIPSGQEEFDPSEIDPRDVQISEHEREINELKLRRIEEEIRHEVRQMQSTYEDFSSEEVLPMVAELGSQGIGLTIEQGYFLWKGRNSVEAERRAAAAKAKADEVAATEAAKRAAAAATGGGQSAAGVSTDDASRYKSMSLEEIFDETWGPES